MKDNNTKERNNQLRTPVSSWHSLVRTSFHYRSEGWLNLLRNPVSDIVIVSTEIEAKLVEEAGHPAVIIEDDVAAVVFTSAVETLMEDGYFIPPLLLLVESLDGLTTTEKILYLSLAKMTPMELVIGERMGLSVTGLVKADWLLFKELLENSSKKVRGEKYKDYEPYS